MNTANAHKAGGTPRLESAGALRIAGLAILCTDSAASDIPALWQRFAGQTERIPERIDSTTYGVCRENSAGQVEYLCGVQVRDASAVPTGFVAWDLTPRRYAVFTHTEHVSTIRSTIHAIFSERLPKAGLAPAKAPFFERYGEQFDPRTGRGGAEIWIPVDR